MDAQPLFSGNARFELRRPLGRGGYGSVFAALDTARGVEVALKALRRMSPEALLRFKNEFRALSGITHRNLVTLYELHAEGDSWFYTMEVVDGAPLLFENEFSTDSDDTPVGHTFELASHTVTEPPAMARLGPPARQNWLSPKPSVNSVDRSLLRALFRQLAEGLEALHQAGKLHRDLKPSNVLVTRDGRVVILDFGLVAELDAVDVARAGTPAYVAPEQIKGLGRAASDWYSVGVMLFEALTGTLPFRGSQDDILASKRAYDGPDPRERLDGLPDDLADLARDLLQRDPAKRPDAAEVLRRLGGAPRIARATTFVGREREREVLARARTGLVLIHGASGMGKSALVQRFVADLRREDPELVALSGRCHERECVPYKAMDGVIDTLTRYLETMSTADLIERLPPGMAPLARLFPVLRQVEAIRIAADAEEDVPDTREGRRRAGNALRQLFATLGEHRHLLIHIDDVQWGDADSAQLLHDVLRQPRPPRLRLIATWRTEGSGAEVPRMLLDLAAQTQAEVLELGGLSNDEARRIAVQILGSNTERVEEAVREAAGHPLFLDGLARAGTAGGGSLGALIANQISELPAPARRLLTILGVAGRPLPRAQLRLAAQIGPAFEAALTALEAGRLVRTAGVGDTDPIEPWHDRIGETVIARLSATELVSHHRTLADALMASAKPDLQHLMVHYRGAGRRDLAARCAEQAADRAAQALAFEHAVGLYRDALELGAPAVGVLPKLAAAQADAGHGELAAHTWLAAAEAAPPHLALSRRHRAAAAFLNAGHMAEGLQQLEQVLSAVGTRLAPDAATASLARSWTRASLRWRAAEFTSTAEADVPGPLLDRIDTAFTVAASLSTVDPARGGEFQAKHLRDALDAGEPYRLALALCLEALYAMFEDPGHEHDATSLVLRAREIGAPADRGHLRAVVQLMLGLIAWFAGRFATAIPLLARAESLLRAGTTGASWELNTARIFQAEAARLAGDWLRLRRLLGRFAAEATATNNRHLHGYVAFAEAAAFAPASGDTAGPRAALAAVPSTGVLADAWAWLAQNELDLYDGDPARVVATHVREWPEYAAAGLDRVAFLTASALHQRARAELAIGETTTVLAAIAASDERFPGFSHQLRAGVAIAAGDVEGAVSHLAAAEIAWRRAEIGLHADASRWVRGFLLGDHDMRTAADAAIVSRGVSDAQKLVRMMFPEQFRARP